MKFPLTTNTVWVSNSSVNEDLPITKKVIGTDTLLIDNQEYPCLKIAHDYPAGITNVSTIQWISKVGLLKEETNSNSALFEPHKMSSIIKMNVLSMYIKNKEQRTKTLRAKTLRAKNKEQRAKTLRIKSKEQRIKTLRAKNKDFKNKEQRL